MNAKQSITIGIIEALTESWRATAHWKLFFWSNKTKTDLNKDTFNPLEIWWQNDEEEAKKKEREQNKTKQWWATIPTMTLKWFEWTCIICSGIHLSSASITTRERKKRLSHESFAYLSTGNMLLWTWIRLIIRQIHVFDSNVSNLLFSLLFINILDRIPPWSMSEAKQFRWIFCVFAAASKMKKRNGENWGHKSQRALCSK